MGTGVGGGYYCYYVVVKDTDCDYGGGGGGTIDSIPYKGFPGPKAIPQAAQGFFP